MRAKTASLIEERAKMLKALALPQLKALGVGIPIGGHGANFVLVPILARPASLGADRDADGASAVNGGSGVSEGSPDSVRAQTVYIVLAETEGVVVRFRGLEPGCDGCLRITVGTPEENQTVITKLTEVLSRM
jgi:histidinol-phosphate aminotransferase